MNPITKANMTAYSEGPHSDHGHRASRAKRGERGTTPYTDFSKNLHRLEVKNAVFSGQYTSMRQLQGFDAHTVPKVVQVLCDSSICLTAPYRTSLCRGSPACRGSHRNDSSHRKSFPQKNTLKVSKRVLAKNHWQASCNRIL